MKIKYELSIFSHISLKILPIFTIIIPRLITETYSPIIMHILKTLILSNESFFIIRWCPRGDLNPHTFRHTHLKRTCLPFHHPGGLSGAPSRVRTYNQRFRRPLLFQLSYGCMLPTSGASEADYSKSIQKCKLFFDFRIISIQCACS
jgi:hypothetical protein